MTDMREVYCFGGPADGAVVICEAAETESGYPDLLASVQDAQGCYRPSNEWVQIVREDDRLTPMPFYRWETA